MKRKLLLLCVATLLALAATGQTPVRQKPPRGRWGAEVNTYVAPFVDGAEVLFAIHARASFPRKGI